MIALLTNRIVPGGGDPVTDDWRARVRSAGGARRPPARAAEHHRTAPRLGGARPRRLHGLPVEDPARRARGAAPRLAQRPPVASATAPRPAAGCLGDPGGRRGNRHHVPPHGRRARHGADPLPAALSARRARAAGCLLPEIGPVVGEALAEALGRLEAGDEGELQADDGSYESFFTADDVWLDLSRPAVEVHRLAWAWRYGYRARRAVAARCSSSTARRCECLRRR